MPDVYALLPGVGLALFLCVSGWFSLRRRHDGHIDRLVAIHKRQIATIASRLADAQRRSDVLKHEVLLLKKEIVLQQSRASRAIASGSQSVAAAAVVHRIDKAPAREERWEEGSGFADTEPWDREIP
jgi:hypothetical protein